VAALLTLLAIAIAMLFARLVVRATGVEIRRDPLVSAVITMALTAGALTQAMLWVALLLPGRLSPGATLVALAGATVAVWRTGRRGRPGGGTPATAARRHAGVATRVLALAVGVAVLAILCGAALWPFADGDALAVYGPLGRTIAATGALPRGEGLYEAYPMLVPMLYAAVEWLVGAPNEYLSRLAAGLLAAGALAGAGWLGRELRSVRAGWFAASLLATCPVYCRWATTGYADIPAGLFVVVVTALLWRWWRDRRHADAVLAGAAAGLAMWTKNSTLTLLVTGPLVVAAWRWCDRSAGRGAADPPASADCWRWSHVVAAGAAAVAVAAPFYLRNLTVFGVVIPPTVWSDRAHRDLAGLLDPLAPGHGFGLLGWVAAAAVVVGIGRLLRRPAAAAAEALVLAVLVPFVAAWWWWASYDPRFLVTVLPVAAAAAGVLLDRALEGVERVRPRLARAATPLLVVAVLAGLPAALRIAVQHKRALLADPLMGDDERHRLQTGGVLEVATAINRLPAGVRVAGVPAAARYYLDYDRLPLVAWAAVAGEPCPAGFDYQVIAPPTRSRASRTPCPGSVVVRTADGWELVALTTGRGGDGGSGG